MGKNARFRTRFVVCIRNTGYPASLEPRKLYEVLDDPAAAAAGRLRVIDESGEDYLYPAGFFVSIELPERLEATLLETS
jgi:hypothetical protein